MEYRKGDKLLCRKEFNTTLFTNGKYYKINMYDGDGYFIFNDLRYFSYHSSLDIKNNFHTLDEIRTMKLERLNSV